MHNDVNLTSGSAQQTNVPDGIDLTPHCGQAFTGISGSGEQLGIDYEVHEDGSVTCTAGYEAVIDGGRITAFRAVHDA